MPQQFRVRERCLVGREEEDGGEDERGRSEIEHTLDNIDGNLGAERELDAPGDEVGAGEVGGTAEQRYSRKADYLRSQHVKHMRLGKETLRAGLRNSAQRMARTM